MKKHFMTGLAILLPMVLTIFISLFVINLVTKPFEQTVRNALIYYHFPKEGVLTPTQVLLFNKLFIIVTLILVIFLIGFVGQLFLVKYLFRLGDFLMHRIPLVNKIYKATQDVIHSLFTTQSTTFSRVVLVPFPHKNTYSLGLITKNELPEGSDIIHQDLISIFVPGTPNPTMGFMLLFRRDQLIFLDMTVEDAFKFVISCGVIFTDFKISNEREPQDISAK